MESNELSKRFTKHLLTPQKEAKFKDLHDRGFELANHINDVCPESREKSLALTHLEQAIMWASAAIARHE